MNGDSRERDALLAIGDLADQLAGDLERAMLALTCLSLEIEDALRPPDQVPERPTLIIIGRPV